MIQLRIMLSTLSFSITIMSYSSYRLATEPAIL